MRMNGFFAALTAAAFLSLALPFASCGGGADGDDVATVYTGTYE